MSQVYSSNTPIEVLCSLFADRTQKIRADLEFIAGHDARLIGQRAASRGRVATEGCDERAGAKRRYPFSAAGAHQRSNPSARGERRAAHRRPRRNAPGAVQRKAAMGGPMSPVSYTVHSRDERREQGRACGSTTPSAASLARSDAPLIGERAATRGRVANGRWR
jgi:hypothetical protein